MKYKLEEVKQVMLYLKPEVHKKLKMLAVEKDTTVSEIVRELVDELLK